MSIIIKPILERIHALYENGMPIQTPSGPNTLRAKLLCCIFDLSARAMALNLIQWNGRFGCTFCLDEGSQVGHVRLYLPHDDHKMGSEKHVRACAGKASKGSPVLGVKGHSILTPYLNIIKDTPIDYMHLILEGVTKTLLQKFWMNGKYKDCMFYLFRQIKSTDEILLQIKPPHEFRR